MKIYKNKLLLSAGFFLLSLSVFVGLGSGTALAATKTWDGGGSDENFSTTTNWSDDSAPVDGDVLVFPASVDSDTTSGDDRALSNDITDLSVAGIQFTGTFADGDYDIYKISGNTLTLTGDITVEDNYGYILTDVTLGADITISGAGYGVYFGDYNATDTTVDIGDHDLTSTVYVSLYGALAGTGDVTAKSLGVQADSPDFSGAVEVTGSKAGLYIYPCTALDGSSGITMAASTTLSLSCSKTAAVKVPITLQGNGYLYTGQDGEEHRSASLNVSTYGQTAQVADIKIAQITLGANATYDSYLNADEKVTITKLVANGKSFTRVPGSQGILLVNGKAVATSVIDYVYDEDYTPEGDYDHTRTVTDMRRYIIKANYLTPFVINKGGILAGTGKVADVTIETGGTIAPGLSPGTLTVASIEWEEGGIYEFEIGKNVADQIKANGTVKLGNGTLSVLLYDGAKPAAGKSYVIIANDGSDAVSGTFKGLPEGATFESDGYVYGVSYKGGDGNDVVLTVQSVPAAPDTGFGMLTNNPILTLAITTGAAATILAIAKRRAKLFGKA